MYAPVAIAPAFDTGRKPYKLIVPFLILALVACGAVAATDSLGLILPERYSRLPATCNHDVYDHFVEQDSPKSGRAGQRPADKELADLLERYLRNMGIQVKRVEVAGQGLIVAYQPGDPGSNILIFKETMRILQLLFREPFRHFELVTLLAISPEDKAIWPRLIRVRDYFAWWDGRIDTRTFLTSWL